VRNRAYPEGSIAEGYIADECLTFCSRFLKGIDKSSSTSINTNLEEENYLFDSFGDTIGSVQDVKFDGKTLIQAHRYVLRHIDELEDFRGYVDLLVHKSNMKYYIHFILLCHHLSSEFIEEEKRRLKKSTITEPAKLID
jgi:hypothetical protein